MALKRASVRDLEGHEAGGHVGQNSTLTLAQLVNDLRTVNHPRLRASGDSRRRRFNRETAFMAAMLGLTRPDGKRISPAVKSLRQAL